jgi:hypothetical protein
VIRGSVLEDEVARGVRAASETSAALDEREQRDEEVCAERGPSRRAGAGEPAVGIEPERGGREQRAAIIHPGIGPRAEASLDHLSNDRELCERSRVG